VQYDDDALLKIVGEERKRSIGFGEGDSGELTDARDRALAYYKGEMNDIPVLKNRSSVVDTAIADAVETVLPDVMEVFVGGEDVATFVPQGQEDEEAAQQETDYVQHVVFTENAGFLTIYTAIKDALITRTGVLHWWWEDDESQETLAEQLTEEQAAVGQQMQPGAEIEPQDDGTVSLTKTTLSGRVCIKAFPSEDFTVAADTVNLRDATYCAVRDRPRVQDLIARGLDAEKVRGLNTYALRNDQIEIDRDQAGEQQSIRDGATGDLRTVEVRAHYIRLDMDGEGKLSVWRVVTDAEERVLLDKEEVGEIPFAALTPYIIPHRFYGESVADKLLQVQQIKTVLLRMLLDMGYFALNQRMEVAEIDCNDYTLTDLLANEPGRPIRSKTGNAIKPVEAGTLNFDIMAAMEFVSTVAESRSGIVRNAQGLNPDTLHDTAKGAMALIGAAQKRVRMIARIFAETGIKDLFLGVHSLLRKGYTDQHKPASAKLRNKWAQVSPNTWPERTAMTVHVGVGSAGREHDMMIATQRIGLMQPLVELQGGANGPFVDPKNVHNALSAWERAAGSKAPEMYWSDPAQAPPQPPKPDPEMAKVQADMQLRQGQAHADAALAQQKAQADAALQAQKHQNDMQASAAQAQRDHELKLAQIQSEGALKRYQVDQELQLKREQLVAELELKRELGLAQAGVAHQVGMAKVNASTSQVEPGGEPG
jgi:hypothetical protein